MVNKEMRAEVRNKTEAMAGNPGAERNKKAKHASGTREWAAERKALDHEACVWELGEKHQETYKEIRDLLDGQRRARAKVWYEVGRKVMKIMADAKYGEKVVAKIAEALGRDASLLYAAGRVAETWLPQQFKKLMDKRDSVRGNRLSWSHFVELASVWDSGRRGLLVKKILAEGLSVRELEREIAGPKPADDQEIGQTTNVAKALRNFKATCETIVENAPRWDTSIFDVLKVQDDELGTSIMLTLLKDVRETQLQAKQTCDKQLARLDACIARSEELLAAPEVVAITPADESRGRSLNLDKPAEDNNG